MSASSIFLEFLRAAGTVTIFSVVGPFAIALAATLAIVALGKPFLDLLTALDVTALRANTLYTMMEVLPFSENITIPLQDAARPGPAIGQLRCFFPQQSGGTEKRNVADLRNVSGSRLDVRLR